MTLLPRQCCRPRFGPLLIGHASLPFIQFRQMRPGIGGVRIKLDCLLFERCGLCEIALRSPNRRSSLGYVELEAAAFGCGEQLGRRAVDSFVECLQCRLRLSGYKIESGQLHQSERFCSRIGRLLDGFLQSVHRFRDTLLALVQVGERRPHNAFARCQS